MLKSFKMEGKTFLFVYGESAIFEFFKFSKSTGYPQIESNFFCYFQIFGFDFKIFLFRLK